MKKCLYDDCQNTEDTPGVELHEVFDNCEANKSMGMYICSYHVNLEIAKQTNPVTPDQKVVDESKKQEESSIHIPAQAESSTVQNSTGNGGQEGSASEKPKKNRHCCAAGCSVSLLTHPDVGLFKFHPSNKRFEKWCLVADLPIRETRLAFVLCARHFHSCCFVDSERRNLKADSDPMYPTGPLNEVTLNYCLYAKEPPLIKRGVKPQDVIVIDDSQDGNVSKKLGRSKQLEKLQPESQPLADGPPISEHGYSLPQSTPKDPSQSENSVEDSNSFIKLCCRHDCNNSSANNENVRFFRLPEDPDPRTEYWFKATGLSRTLRHRIHMNDFYLCSEHFDSSQFENETTLKATALPLPDTSVQKTFVDKWIKCEAVGCPSSYKKDPSLKFFKIGNSSRDPGSLDRWKAMLGGVTSPSDSRFTICQLHFPEKAFADAQYRTRLRRARDYCLFPFGQINPRTGDFCPEGQEELSIIYLKERILICCVRGCHGSKPLFKFPHYDDKAFNIWCLRAGICRLRYSKEYITNIMCLCGIHFDARCKVSDTKTNTVYLSYGALPTFKLPNFYGNASQSSIFLEDDSPPPNATELAQSLLVKPNEGVPARTITPEIEDSGDGAPGKKQKMDSAVKKFLPAMRMVPEDELPRSVRKTKGVTHWAPADFIEPISGKQRYLHKRGRRIVDDSKIPAEEGEQKTEAAFPEVSLLKTPHTTARSVFQFKPGPKRKFRPDENRPSTTIKEFLDDFVGDMSSPDYSPPPSPEGWDPLAKTRDACVQTEILPETPPVDEVPKKIDKEVEGKLEELQCLEIGNEVDVPLLVDNKTTDRSVWNQISKENTLEQALIGIFNSCKSGEDNAFSSISDKSTVPEPGNSTSHNHQYSTDETVNVLRSAAQLCEFNAIKVKQLEQLLQLGEQGFSELEDTLVKHLSAVMCIAGVEIVKKCFEQVLKDAISREKGNDKNGSGANVDGKKNTEYQYPLSNSSNQQQYSADTKQMSKALLAYSGRAFQLLRLIADLPPPYLVRGWSTYPDGSPGFSDKAFKMLKQHNSRTNKVRMCSLSIVDVPLRKEVTWDGARRFGLEDLGFGCLDNDCIREASKVVVFYLKFLSEDKTLPLGYVLADELTPQVRANLIIQYIAYLDAVGIKCLVLVSDYSVTTYETYSELGAFVDESDTGWFNHPFNKSTRIMCFTDVFQNVQALSSLWAEKRIFRSSPKAETPIDQDHIALGDAYLNAPQDYSSVPAMTKFLSNLKLEKSLAQADPLSTNKYNAVMLTILRNLGIKKFSSASQTIKYLESLTAVTDIFSSTHPFDAADRRPLTCFNSSKVQSRLAFLSSYFGGLCFGNGKKILTTNRKLPVAMMKMNLCSLKNLLKRMFYGEKSNRLEFFCKSLSLEDVNSTVETMCGGAKRLVSATEFKKGFQKYMEEYDWTPSRRLLCDRISKYPVTELSLGFKNTFTYEFVPFNSISESALEFLRENVIETWMEQAKCAECSQLVQNGILTYRDYDLEGNVVRDIHKMLQTAETCLAEYSEIPCDSYDTWFIQLSNKTLNSLKSVSGFKSCNHLFVSVRFGEISHFTFLVKDMLRIYLQLRMCFLNREERIKIQAPREHSMKFNLGRSWT